VPFASVWQVEEAHRGLPTGIFICCEIHAFELKDGVHAHLDKMDAEFDCDVFCIIAQRLLIQGGVDNTVQIGTQLGEHGSTQVIEEQDKEQLFFGPLQIPTVPAAHCDDWQFALLKHSDVAQTGRQEEESEGLSPHAIR
jgi:hypothetical protein